MKCAQCGKDIADGAAYCGSCGARKADEPAPAQSVSLDQDVANYISRKPVMAAAIIFLMLAVLLVVFDMFNSPKHEPSPENDAAACKKDLQCWGEKNLSGADVYCKDNIERLAKYSVKWTDSGLLNLKFSRYSWIDKYNGTVRYIGDKAQFQNGFGAYQNVIYACDFNPNTKTVLHVTAEPGHL